MSRKIVIPKVERDERIGSVFNYLFSIINATESSGEPIIWDFGNASFSHPFFLAPLAIFKDRSETNITCANCPAFLSGYLSLIHFERVLHFDNVDSLKSILSGYAERTYTPICKFRLADERSVDAMQSVFQDIIRHQTDYGSELHTALSYMIGELVCNISQHSRSEFGYIYSQYLRKEGCLTVCIADNGITIYGSYANSGLYLDEIGDNEAYALRLANSGYSTKSTPERGFGLSTTRNILVKGLGGAFFELSGGAFYRYEAQEEVYVMLPKSIFWDGTIILMRIPVCVPRDFCLYNYIK